MRATRAGPELDLLVHERVLGLRSGEMIPRYSTDEEAAEQIVTALHRIGFIGLATLTHEGLSPFNAFLRSFFALSGHPRAWLLENVRFTWYFVPTVARAAVEASLTSRPSECEPMLRLASVGSWSAVASTRACAACIAALQIPTDKLSTS